MDRTRPHKIDLFEEVIAWTAKRFLHQHDATVDVLGVLLDAIVVTTAPAVGMAGSR